MAHAARSMSPKERRDAKNARILIGREDQQDLFTRSLVQPEHREAKLVFSISGQGGVGKTTLLKEYRLLTVHHAKLVPGIAFEAETILLNLFSLMLHS